MLPDIPGTEICRRIRGGEVGGHQPAVLMLTAKSEEIDRVVGFELGADDYVVKPFSVRELVLRTEAASDRARTCSKMSGVTSPTSPHVPSIHTSNDCATSLAMRVRS